MGGTRPCESGGGPCQCNPYMVRVILPFAELFHVEQFENHKRRGFNLAA